MFSDNLFYINCVIHLCSLILSFWSKLKYEKMAEYNTPHIMNGKFFCDIPEWSLFCKIGCTQGSCIQVLCHACLLGVSL